MKKKNTGKKNIGNRKRILYAVCGEGMGHAIRSVPILNHLKKDNDILIVSHGKPYEYLSKKFDGVYSIEGFNIVYENNVLKSRKTLFNAIKKLPKGLRKNLLFLYRMIRSFRPNLIISDFEPFSNMVSKIMRIPMISINNQHIVTKTLIKLPRRYMSAKLQSYAVLRSYAVRPKKYLITTFFYPTIKNKKRAKLFPPILREEVIKIKPSKKDHMLVYQTSDSYSEMMPVLKSIDQKFIIYGHNKEEKDGNLVFRKFNEKQFLKELSSCKAVITNGGFTLIGEALYLGKPVLSVPVKNQFEQIVNAIYLEKLGYGKFYEELDKKKIEKFLSELDAYRKNLEKYERKDNSEILDEIDALIERCSKRYKKKR